MRVLYIALGGKGGSDKALLDLLSAMVPRFDIDPLVVCGMPDLIPKLKLAGIKSVHYDFAWMICPPAHSVRDKILYIPRYIKSIFKRRKDVFSLSKIIGNFNPDLISTNVGVVNIGFKLGKLLNIPHIWHVREFQRLDHGMRYVGGIGNFKRVLKINRYNIAVTRCLYSYFDMHAPAVHIYDGVRSQRNFCGGGYSPQGYFIFAGFLFQGKGVDELLKAYHTYRTRGGQSELYILGSWNPNNPFHMWIREYIDSNELKSAKLLGFRDDVDDLMSRSTAVIVPSRFEAFGRVTCEAMFNKTLVIGKNTAGTKEQFDNFDEYFGEAASLRYTTKEELVNRMFEADSISSTRRHEIVDKQFELVNKLYTNEASASSVYAYYESVIKSFRS